jgi:polyisoprenoid-binding protein YceI
LTIAGKSKAISFDTDIARNADAVSVAGKTIIDRNDFLQFDLSNAPVGIDTNVTLEFSIVLRQSAGA